MRKRRWSATGSEPIVMAAGVPPYRAAKGGGVALLALATLLILASFLGCSQRPDPNTLVMIIESSPANLDPRVGTDAQSERISELIFDPLVRRDEHFNLQPWVAERWENPDPLTYIFHLRRGIRFHDGRALTARDVKFTLDSIVSGRMPTPKANPYREIARTETPDDHTVIIRLRAPFAPLLWNLSDGAFGIVPEGSWEELSRKPIGSGPFRFVSAQQDREVIIERNDAYWAEKARLPRVRFMVIPDATTRALELRKGSADIELNALPADTVRALRQDPSLAVQEAPGTTYAYIAMNLRDPILQDVRVRQAVALAINRQPIIHYLMGDAARPANSVLPPQHWAYNPNLATVPYDPAKANAILDAAGYKRTNGVRFHLTMKTSTEEGTRLLATVLQQQLREIGIELNVRTFEFATFYADVTKGVYQVHSLRWVGASNEDPDIFEHIFHSSSFAPRRANRTFYVNPRVDELIVAGRTTNDQEQRRRIYFELQEILNRDLPYIHLWYIDHVLVRTHRVRNVSLPLAGNYDFLRTAELAQ